MRSWGSGLGHRVGGCGPSPAFMADSSVGPPTVAAFNNIFRALPMAVS